MYIDLMSLKRAVDSFGRHVEQQPTQLLVTDTVAAKSPQEYSVAVLNFQNITGDPKDDWIGSGIAETVTGDLKMVRGLSVIARERIFEILRNTGSGELREPDETFAIELGRRTGAAWIIGGGYQRMSDMIRITARLTDVKTGSLVKTVKIDGGIDRIFDLQDRIVYELSSGLNLQLAEPELAEITHKETQSVEAYEHFSRGLLNLRATTRDSLDRAVYHWDRASRAITWSTNRVPDNQVGHFMNGQMAGSIYYVDEGELTYASLLFKAVADADAGSGGGGGTRRRAGRCGTPCTCVPGRSTTPPAHRSSVPPPALRQARRDTSWCGSPRSAGARGSFPAASRPACGRTAPATPPPSE